MTRHRHRLVSKNYVLVDIWNTTRSFPYNCHWAPEASTADIKRDLDRILNAEKSWLVKPHHMHFVSTSGADLNIEEPCDLKAIKELAMCSYHDRRDLCLRIKVVAYPRFLYVVAALFVTIIFILAFCFDKEWAQHVFFGLVGMLSTC
ncbi:hypothetical protein Q9L58_001460 [Maublancomyces gigas]|uniref:Uncharacterized protein n=1 Tax=Discina gigas TaxID=1032678 RepID=A0ABR3GUN6_9PEZI